MAGSVDVDLLPVSLNRFSRQTAVFRYDPNQAGNNYVILPHVRFVNVSRQEGPDPWIAQFRYAFDDVVLKSNFPTIPTRAEDVFGLNATNPWRVEIGERLVALEYDTDTPGGETRMVFDGYVSTPQIDLTGESETATWTAIATPIRCFDKVIETAPYRNAHKWKDEVQTVDVGYMGCWRFNPDDRGNCTVINKDEFQNEPHSYPLFIDPRIPADRRRKWHLASAARTLVWANNFNETFVNNPTYAEMIDLLYAKVPTTDGGAIDDSDDTTFEYREIEIPDVDFTGQAWPRALWDLLTPFGFTFRWELKVKDSQPDWYMVLDRKDSIRAAKDFRLAKNPSYYDSRATNVSQMSVAHDGQIENEFSALTEPVQVECGVTLAPLFEVLDTDAGEDTKKNWKKGETTFDPTKYRRWGVDETGTGSASVAEGEGEPEAKWGPFVEGEPLNLDALFDTGEGFSDPDDPPPKEDEGDGSDYPIEPPPLLIAARPGYGEIFALDADGNNRKSTLYISTDYAGEVPGIFDGTGKWQEVTGGGWKLLEDRLGIELTDDDLEEWNVGTPPADMVGAPFPSGTVKVVSATAKPGVGGNPKRFTLLLVTIIDGDHGIGGLDGVVAARRPASPLGWEVRRADETRDRYKVQLIDRSSKFFEDATGKSEGLNHKIARDDRKLLKAHLAGRRRANETGGIIGTVTVPYITHAYHLGDRIRGLAGRFISFRTNVPYLPTETAVFPVIAGISWSYDGTQETTISLSDRRSETNQ